MYTDKKFENDSSIGKTEMEDISSLSVLIAVIVIIATSFFIAPPWCHFGWGGWIGPRFVFPWIGPWLIIFLAAFVLVYAVLWIVRDKDTSDGISRNTKKSSLEILDERLAMGDITIEEYRAMKRELKEN